jgi:hypothetical protein
MAPGRTDESERAGLVRRAAVPLRALRAEDVAEDFLPCAGPWRALGAAPPRPLRRANFPLRPFN